jgi:hypothetical protein
MVKSDASAFAENDGGGDDGKYKRHYKIELRLFGKNSAEQITQQIFMIENKNIFV